MFYCANLFHKNPPHCHCSDRHRARLRFLFVISSKCVVAIVHLLIQNTTLSPPPGSILPCLSCYRLALTLGHTLHAVTGHERGVSHSSPAVSHASHHRGPSAGCDRVLQSSQPLPLRTWFSRASSRCKGNVGYFSAEYNLLHILHLISDEQNTGGKQNKVLHQELVTTEEFCS